VPRSVKGQQPWDMQCLSVGSGRLRPHWVSGRHLPPHLGGRRRTVSSTDTTTHDATCEIDNPSLITAEHGLIPLLGHAQLPHPGSVKDQPR
jgi:hypothetical protein